MMIESSVPLETDNGGNGLMPTDLGLVETPSGWRSSNPLVPVAYSARLDSGVDLARLGISVVPEFGGRSDPAVMEGDRVYWANARRDTDLLVEPTPAGAEFFALLRSPDAESELSWRLDLPAGARLRAAGSGAEVVLREKQIAAIPPPVAHDAAGNDVALKLRVEGNRIVVKVDPADDAAWPLLVDPEITDTTLNNSYEPDRV